MPPRTVPAFLSIHVEPDAYQLGREGPATWSGYDAMNELVSALRPVLGDLQGAPPCFSWMFRMDPQIQATSLAADHAVTGFGDRVDRLASHGDVFGIHVHPLRWSDERGLWVHDFADPTVARQCIESSVEAFTRTFGSLPRRHSYGAALLGDHVVEILEEVGVWVDITADRRYLARVSRRHPEDATTGVDTSPVIGVLTDGSRIPTFPYRPSHTTARRSDDRNGRQLIVVPLTATPRHPDRPQWRRTATWFRHGLKTPLMTMYPAKTWPSPRHYWDLVQREIESMRRPYIAISVRSDAPGSPAALNARALLEHLPLHPVARQLRFVDPVEGAPWLLSDRARRGLTWARDGASALSASPAVIRRDPPGALRALAVPSVARVRR